MNNGSNYFSVNDPSIKQGVEALASDISVPDPSASYKKYKKQYKRYNIVRPAIVASILVLILAIATIEPVAAFRRQIRETITQMISQTDKLFQRTGGEEELSFTSDVVQSYKYNTLDELQKEKPANIFIPAGLQSNQFISAEALSDSGFLLKMSIFIDYNGIPLLLRYEQSNNYLSAGRTIDIEDFNSDSFVIKGHEVTCFYDDRGYTMLEWENDRFLIMFDGDMSVIDLINAGLSLRVFD